MSIVIGRVTVEENSVPGRIHDILSKEGFSVFDGSQFTKKYVVFRYYGKDFDASAAIAQKALWEVIGKDVEITKDTPNIACFQEEYILQARVYSTIERTMLAFTYTRLPKDFYKIAAMPS